MLTKRLYRVDIEFSYMSHVTIDPLVSVETKSSSYEQCSSEKEFDKFILQHDSRGASITPVTAAVNGFPGRYENRVLQCA